MESLDVDVVRIDEELVGFDDAPLPAPELLYEPDEEEVVLCVLVVSVRGD